MQRYHNAASCTSGVNNPGIGCHSSRDSGRPDSNSLSSNFSLNSRRASPLVAYKLKCEKEPLNSRLGPPDFQSQTPNCPEETLTKEYVQSGYRETIEGLEEAKETSATQINIFTKPVVLKCKEAIRKRHRAINESRALKRKAGQVYGEPLSGSLLSKPGVFPELKPCSEDFKKRWFEGLSQYHKSLRSLADHAPQGFRKKSLFEILIRNKVPLLRATWFIKVNYLNQFRPSPSGTRDKNYLTRTEQWTKDVTDYLQGLLDQLLSRNNLQSIPHNRNRSSQMMYAASALVDVEEPSLHFKWWYVVRLLHWHLSQGLILPYQVLDWIFLQFQDTDLHQVMQFLLPIIYGLLETIILCQTYVRNLVVIALRYLKEPSSSRSDLVDNNNSQKTYISNALAEMIQYLIVSVPDTFVALDCFPLPPCLGVLPKDSGHVYPKLALDAENLKNGSSGVPNIQRDKHDVVKYSSSCLNRVASSIQKCAKSLSQAASPGYPRQNVAKGVQALDKAILHGDILEAYQFLFVDQSDFSVGESWVAEVSSCLRSSLKWIGYVCPSLIYSVFLLCEWCTCDFRDVRTALSDVKFTGRKDFSQLLVAARLMKLKVREIQREEKAKGGTERIHWHNYQRKFSSNFEMSDLFESPGPLHDIIVCWLDQHDARKGEGFKRVQLLLLEFMSLGIFSPQAYMRQLLVSGIMDNNKSGSLIDLTRRNRHCKILKQLPSSCMRDVFSETRIADTPVLLEAVHVYTNERRLLLRGEESQTLRNSNSSLKQKEQKISREELSASSLFHLKLSTLSLSSSFPESKRKKHDANIERLKISISELLCLPATSTSAVVDESPVSSMKRAAVTLIEATPGCEECQRAKRQKLGDETYSFLQGSLPYQSHDDGSWWMRKEPKSTELSKVDQPVKASKVPSRGRQKNVRKTQSLNQLATARIEGSQGASTSHVCDNRVTCHHHHPVIEGDAPNPKPTNSIDLFTIGKLLKRLKLVEKRSISRWLVSCVKQVIEETERSAKVGQTNRSLSSIEEKSCMRWKLGEDELSVILYLMDTCVDLTSAIRFLIWVLPKAHASISTSVHGGRNLVIFPRNSDTHACEVREPFVLSSIRRYENILIAADLIPEVLTAAMNCAAAVVASNGRLSGSPTFLYARYLMNKYATIRSVGEWEKSFKASCDKRLLSEFESVRLQNGVFGFSFAIPSGVNDLDDFIRQKMGVNKLSKSAIAMREAVQEKVNLAFQCLFNKERKLFGASVQKNGGIEKWDYGYQIAQQIVGKLMDEMRPLSGGAIQEGDLSLVACAVSAIVGSVGPAIAKMPDFTAAVVNHSNLPIPPTGSLGFARRILKIHIDSLCLLKEALGERYTRVFEIALATEASSALGAVLTGKGSRGHQGQLQFSPEGHESNVNMCSDIPNNNPTKVAVGKATKTAAAVSALIIEALIHGVSSLERMITVFRIRENLDLMQFVRSFRSHANGNARSLKMENALEVYIHLFRLLVGNCRLICDGVIVELLGEPSVIALSRMQRTLPLKSVLPPAYSLFAFFIWKPYILGIATGNRDEIPQWFQSLTLAIGDAVKHSPFRDICMRNIHGFLDMVNSDATDSDFASFLKLSGSDSHFKASDVVPLRSRLFLNALVDCKLPNSQCTETEAKIADKVVNALDTLQPAKFHWQWIELRLLLSEQTLIEKLDPNVSIAEAMRSLVSHSEKDGSSENENNFIPIVLTRLVVRPDAAPLLAELLHLFGRSWEDSLLSHIRWFLDGHDVLFGRKSIRHRLKNLAEDNRFSTKTRFWNHWGWSQPSSSDPVINRADRRRCEGMFVEEGEVVETDNKRHVGTAEVLQDHDALNANHELVIDRAFIELVLPCIDRTSDDSRNRCASELIKQMNNIAQQIKRMTCPSSKQAGPSNTGTEGLTNKSNRKGVKGGTPAMARRASIAAVVDSSPVSPVALRASLSLRLQLLVRLLPTICADGDTSGRSLRYMLASVILGLLGSRVVYEDMYLTHNNPGHGLPSMKEAELQMETSGGVVSLDLSGKYIFNWLLLVFHALLGSSQPSWLRFKSSSSKSNMSLTFSGFDRELLDGFQNELDKMQLPEAVRQRIQAAMPILPRNPRSHISCHLPSVSSTALVSLQPITTISPSIQPTPFQKHLPTSVLGKSKAATTSQLDNDDVEIDPWLVLEDGAGSEPSSVNTSAAPVMGGSDPANLKANSLLKGAVRVRRTDLTYIAAISDDN